ncbi:MAG: SLC13 family permease [Candidatus Lokiarchaeia archaeon]|nr:SLC13 family permease [Candidatus Lokiarchaeia archaeon]
MDLWLLIVIFAIFAIILISYSSKKFDFVVISLFCCFLAGAITGIAKGLTINYFVSKIEFEAIIVILCMSIITKIAQDSNILEFLAVKLFKISKGNRKIFFYLLCIITTLLAAIISDVVVVLILAPVVIRLCRFLKIKAGTYLLGMTICINIGSIITPFSSGENIIISSAFSLNTIYFITYYWIFSFFLLFITAFLMDKFQLSKEPEIEELQKKYVLDLVDAKVMISNKKMFYVNSIGIIITIILFAILPFLYLTAAFSAFTLVLVNRKFTKKKLGEFLKDIEWEIIFFFISLYVVIGCLEVAGFEDLFRGIPFEVLNPFLVSLIILLLVSFVSGFVANTPTALVFIPIINLLVTPIVDGGFGFPSIPLFYSLIIAVNIGGNLIPQGAACDVMTLKIAQNNDVENFSFKRLLKVGATFAIIHIILSIGYLSLLSLFYG